MCMCTNEKKRQRSSKESAAPTDTSNCHGFIGRQRIRVSGIEASRQNKERGLGTLMEREDGSERAAKK